MKRKCLSILSFLALLVCLTAVGVLTAQAQTRDKYLVSAKAGGINFVSGNVTVVRKGTSTPLAVTDQDNLENGDVVTTGRGGRVEVLLNPGSYMRVGENSEFEMTDTSLESLRLRLLSGSAILEVVGTDDTKLSLEILTPQTNAVIVKRGIYRFNVLPSGSTEVLVRKGRALVGPSRQEIKGGKMITIGRGNIEMVAKIDKRVQDSLELWSRERAEYLASVNRSIAPRATASIDYSSDIFSNNNYYDRYRGAWVYDSQRGCYVFLPGRSGSSSPYGYDYRGRCCGNGRGNETPANVPAPNPPGGGVGSIPPGGTPAPDAPTTGSPGRPVDPDSGSRDRPLEPVDRGGERPERPITRPDAPEPVNRPDNSPVSRPEPPSMPSEPSSPPPQSSPPPSSPPPSPPPSEAPSRPAEAPVMRENPND